jgi:hypothetical protein
MFGAIKERIETGRIKNVVAYGGKEHPAPPYVVFRYEDETNTLRVFVHMLPGQQAFLREYVKSDLSDLLDRYMFTDRHGNRNKILPLEDGSGILPLNDDGTISMERRFRIPSWFSMPTGGL